LKLRLWDYLGGIVRGEGGTPLQIGGIADHVHLLVRLRQDLALADFLRQMKAVSSGWVHKHFPTAIEFQWQSGYGAFTVSHSAIDSVKAYIANQDEDHKARSFQDEFRASLLNHGFEFDEQYFWD
jgi:hypothetical protein